MSSHRNPLFFNHLQGPFLACRGMSREMSRGVASRNVANSGGPTP